MRRVICVGISLAMVVAFVSAFAGVIGKTDNEVRTIAEPILDNILKGMKTSDYASYSRDFNNTMKKGLPEKKFLAVNQQIRNQLGDYKSREYLGFLKKRGMTVVLWKSTFDKSKDDILIKLTVSKQKDKYLVTGLWFQ